jgi:hypothetical protein
MLLLSNSVQPLMIILNTMLITPLKKLKTYPTLDTINAESNRNFQFTLKTEIFQFE